MRWARAKAKLEVVVTLKNDSDGQRRFPASCLVVTQAAASEPMRGLQAVGARWNRAIAAQPYVLHL